MRTLRRPRAVQRAHETSHPYWYGAYLIDRTAHNIVLVTQWRNPELAGIWESTYRVTRDCFNQLYVTGKLRRCNETPEGVVYELILE